MRIGLDIFARLRLAGASAGAVARPFEWAAPAARVRPNMSVRELTESAWGLLSAEEDRWFPWMVVAFAGGDGIYFALSAEPAIWLALAAAALALVPLIWGMRASGAGLRFFCALIAATGLGFAAAKLRTEMVTAPVIARDGAMAGLRQSDGTLVLLAKKPDEYTATQWLQREGDRRDWKTAMAGAHCDELGCVAHAADGKIVSLALRPGALIDDCARADVLVSRIPVRQECAHPQLAVDRLQLARDRATAVWSTQNQMKIETVAAARGQRPWVAQYLRTRPTSLP